MNTEYQTQREDSIRMFAPGSVISMIARSYVIPREIKGKTARFENSARTRTARFEANPRLTNLGRIFLDEKVAG